MIALRCDAGAELGLGHLSRCLNLADALRERGESCTIFVRELAPELARWASARGHRVEALGAGEPPGAAPRLEELDELERRARELGARWIVLDHYAYDDAALGRLARVAALCVIDDLADRGLHAASLVWRPTPAADGRSDTALLHPAFAAARGAAPARSLDAPPGDLLLVLGGTGSRVKVEALAAQVQGVLPDARIRATGLDPGESAVSGLEALGRLDPPVLARAMLEADLAIGSASGVAWELACLGVPTLLCVVADNQRGPAAALADATGVPVAGSIPELGPALGRWLDLPAAERRAVHQRWTAICDGRGAERLADALLDAPRAGLSRSAP